MNDVWLALIGFVAGLSGGLLGVGGSVVMIPGMTLLFGLNQHLYQAAAMIVNCFVVIPAAWRHARAGAMLRPIVAVTIPTAAVSVVVGVLVSAMPIFAGGRQVYLARVFAAFLVYVAGYNIWRLANRSRLPDMDEQAARGIPRWRTALAVGVPTGFAAGLLGIGGGAVAVPFQQVFLRVPLKRAIANSAATIICLSIIGATLKNYTLTAAGTPLTDSLRLAIVLIPTAMVGSYLGAGLTHALPVRAVRGAFVALMLYAAWRLGTMPARSPVRPAEHAGPTPPADRVELLGPEAPIERVWRGEPAGRARPIEPRGAAELRGQRCTRQPGSVLSGC